MLSHFPPLFLPAQAEGRAHRLGQTRTVMVYQMITPGSVEEAMSKHAARKRRLESVVMAHLGANKGPSVDDVRVALLHGNHFSVSLHVNPDLSQQLCIMLRLGSYC